MTNQISNIVKNKFSLFFILFLFGLSVVLINSSISFAAAPTVTTGSSKVGLTTVTLDGELTAINDTSYNTGFVLGTASVADADGGNYNVGTSTIASASTTAGSWSSATTSLSKGEVYYFRTWASSTVQTAPSLAYGAEQKFITGIDEPTSFAESSHGHNSISFSWATTTGANAVEVAVVYNSNRYPASTTDGTVGCTVNGTSCTVSSLGCSSTYYFRSWSSTTDAAGGLATTSAAYGELKAETMACQVAVPGISPSPPTTYSDSLVINGGAAATQNREVNLALHASNVTYMTICHRSDFVGCALENYAAAKSWTLTEGDGEKTVYVKFVSPGGVNSEFVSATITLETSAPVEVEEIAEAPAAEEVVEEEVIEELPAPKEKEPVTAENLRTKIQELQLRLINLLNQWIQLLQDQINSLLGGVFQFFGA